MIMIHMISGQCTNLQTKCVKISGHSIYQFISYSGFSERTLVIFETMDKNNFVCWLNNVFLMGKILNSGLIRVMKTLQQGNQLLLIGIRNLNPLVQTLMILNVLVTPTWQLFRKTSRKLFQNTVKSRYIRELTDIRNLKQIRKVYRKCQYA